VFVCVRRGRYVCVGGGVRVACVWRACVRRRNPELVVGEEGRQGTVVVCCWVSIGGSL